MSSYREYPPEWDVYKKISYLIDETVESYASHEHESYFPGIEEDLMPKIETLIKTEVAQKQKGARIDERGEMMMDALRAGFPDGTEFALFSQLNKERLESLQSTTEEEQQDDPQ